METKNFSKSEAIRFGWDTAKGNFFFFLALSFIMLLVVAPPLIAVQLFGGGSLVPFLLIITSFGLSIIMQMGYIKILLKFVDNKKGELGDLFSCTHLFVRYVLASSLYFLIVFGGLLLFIIPGIIWAIKFQFYPYLIVEKSMGPIEALRKSSKITQGVKWNLLLFSCVVALVNMGGSLAVIGSLWTVPTTMVATAFVYRKLLNQAEGAQPIEMQRSPVH